MSSATLTTWTYRGMTTTYTRRLTMCCIGRCRWYHPGVQTYRQSPAAAEPKDPLEEAAESRNETPYRTDQVATTSDSDQNEIETKDTSKFVAMFTPKLKKKEIQNVRNNIPTQRVPMYKPPPFTYKEKFFYPLRKAMGAYSKWAIMANNARTVFRSLEEQATQDCWFDALGLDRTWLNEHNLIALHVWIVHRRHMIDLYGEREFNGRLADKELFDYFWEDTQRRIRNAGVGEVSVNKQLEMVQKATFMDMFEYDAGIAVTDDDNLELAGALFRGIFQSDENVNTETVLQLADWVREEVWNILTHPKEDFYRGWITWSPALGETKQDRVERQKQMFRGEWRESIWADGKIYFYNTVTGESTQEIPEEGLYSKRRWALQAHVKKLEEEGKISAEKVEQILGPNHKVPSDLLQLSEDSQ
eukprot:gb/GECG01006958.1/.p1 GENE.gb/GECG01006958.1/~~gb/GECG01006958.1/.p1  ORF type:complete len:416 (+),score=59.94 gb/GECG01006958.1/:1-1248(+)